MRDFKVLLLTTIFIFLFFFPFKEVYGCVALYSDVPICFQYTKADAIYFGELINDPQPTETENFQKLTFEIKETFKGEAKNRIEILNLVKEFTSCDVIQKVQKGETWVIFASKNNDNLFLSDRSFQYISKYHQKEINFLRKAGADGLETAIHGQVKTTCITGGSKLNLAGMKVSVQGEGVQLTTQTDKFGAFSFTRLPAGSYKIRIAFPFNTQILNPLEMLKTAFDRKSRAFNYEYQTTVIEGTCQFNATFFRRQAKDGNKCN